MNRIRTKHKIMVEQDQIKAHYDYDCQCYSNQGGCAVCTLNRVIKNNLDGDVFFCEAEQELVILVCEERYTYNEQVGKWLDRVEELYYYRMPEECVLLFKEDLTLDIRLLP